MFLVWDLDLSLGLVKNNKHLLFLQQKQNIKPQLMPVRKLYGFDISFQFGFEQQQPTPLWCDNQSSIKLAKDRVLHQRSKQIELHMHFIRNLVHDCVLEMLYCSTDDQVADIFTKSLTKVKFSKLRSMLGLQECVLKGG